MKIPGWLVTAVVLGCGTDPGATVASPPDAGETDAAVRAEAGAAVDGAADAGATPATCDVPISAPDTSKPTTIVGTGAGTCTEAALASAVAKGGTITFNCGDHATIAIGKTLSLRTDVDTIIDGGGKVTLDGGGKVRIMSFEHPDFRKNDAKLTLMRLSLSHGKVAGADAYAAAAAPCSQGFYDGYGGALYFRDGVLAVFDTVFDANVAEALGPDVGGGAISIHGAKKVTIAGSTFRNGSGSNGGAIESLNSELDVYNSVFEDNVAVGHGANGDDASKCSVVAKNGQHQTGSGGNGGAISIDGGSDLTHTFCGLVFRRNKAGAAALGGAIFRTPDGPKQPTVIDRSTFDGNLATAGGGGALYFHNSALSITASTFVANKAKGCGAVQSDGTTVDWSNDTFSANEATATGGVGGALCLFGVNGELRNITFSDNRADGFGAAIFGNPTLSIDNSLFSGNLAQNPGAPMQCQVTATGQGNLQFPGNHAVGGSPDAPCAAAITFADPTLSAIASNGGPTQTMLPKAGSPALKLGSSCPAADQRGVARPAQGCTAGAVEGTQ